MRRHLSIACVALLTACATAISSSAPVEIELPLFDPAGNDGCAGAMPLVTVRLDPEADPPAWFEMQGGRLDVLWPAGHRLVTDPMAVIDADGAVILRNGEQREVEICATAEHGMVVFQGAP